MSSVLSRGLVSFGSWSSVTVVDAVASEGSWESAEDSISTTSSRSVVVMDCCGVDDVYSFPSSHIDAPESSSKRGAGS